jgi:hypothetical protein
MVPITIVNGVYKPSNITGGPHIVESINHPGVDIQILQFFGELPPGRGSDFQGRTHLLQFRPGLPVAPSPGAVEQPP